MNHKPMKELLINLNIIRLIAAGSKSFPLYKSILNTNKSNNTICISEKDQINLKAELKSTIILIKVVYIYVH